MVGVDELFTASGVPSKRKLEPVRDPSQVYKSARLSHASTAQAQRDAFAPGDDEAGPAPPPDEDDDGDYGPAMPPDTADAEDDDDDDEDGRFFGGGVTAQESRALDYINAATDAGGTVDLADPEEIDLAWLKKTALKFEQRITRNAAQRAKYEAEPAKFIQSEADLDADLRALSILGEHPHLYPALVKLGTVGSLVGLLAHENTDIVIGAIEILGELTDEDVAAEDAQWDALVAALLAADVVGLLVSNLQRLDEDGADDADREGVYKALGVVENLCSGQGATADTIGADEGLVRWLLQRIQKKERPTTQNKQYAAEILAILVQSSAANRRALAAMDAVDVLLQLVAAYRKLDPAKGEEEEYMENLFEALTSIADEPEGKAQLVAAEGVELCLIMLREGKRSKPAALRLVDHAVGGGGGGGASGAEVCRKLVDAGGLKTLFTMFMKTQKQQQHKPTTTTNIITTPYGAPTPKNVHLGEK